MSLTLVIANTCYSSWSLRPWILMRHLGIRFDEVMVPLGEPTTRDALLRHTPSAKAPCLLDGDLVVWDSLSIIEYLAETFPELAVWPKERPARAMARSLAAEMHAGFAELRSQLPMNMRREVRKLDLTPGAKADVARLEQAFAAARAEFGSGGDFLFGAFSAADAMFAPVVNRLHIYDVPVTPTTRTYMDRMMELLAWREWAARAGAEPWTLAKFERPAA
jgi:glutathione S-transferase